MPVVLQIDDKIYAADFKMVEPEDAMKLAWVLCRKVLEHYDVLDTFKMGYAATTGEIFRDAMEEAQKDGKEDE
jgi:hypothetical protein